jgi:hypothetical protein
LPDPTSVIAGAQVKYEQRDRDSQHAIAERLDPAAFG